MVKSAKEVVKVSSGEKTKCGRCKRKTAEIMESLETRIVHVVELVDYLLNNYGGEFQKIGDILKEVLSPSVMAIIRQLLNDLVSKNLSVTI